MNKACAFVLIIISGLALFFCSRSKPSSTDIVKITNVNKFITEKDINEGVKRTKDKKSEVIFSHQAHEDHDVKCVVCHHKFENDDRIKNCAMCHKGKEGEDYYHTLCIDCHKKKKEGPVECDECHLQNDL